MTLKRRDFLKLAGIGAGAAVAGGSLPGVAGAAVTHPIPEILGSSKGKRLVVLGASFGGINTALALHKAVPDAEIVLIDKAPYFVSCPATMEYLFGMVSLDKITRGYASLQAKGFKMVRADILAVDRGARRVVTSAGAVSYDQLLVATGIRLAYEAVPGLMDKPEANLCMYDKGAPMIDLHHRITAFKGGAVVVNAPAGPYKCPPGPYEYALLWAAHIKKNKLKAKVHMVDPGAKPIPPGVAAGFLKAIEANKDVLAYAPNTNILNVSAKDSMIETEAGKIKYDFLSIIPPNKTMGFIKEAGLGDPFIAVDPVTFRSKADERVFALGDNAATPYSKSAYTAAQSAKIAGAFIARGFGAKTSDPGAPHNICYPLVSMDSAIMVRADWSHGKDKDGKPAVITKGASDNDAKAQLLMLRREWEKGLLREMFGA